MKKRMTILSLTAMALVAGSIMVQDAVAGVRVTAKIITPVVTVRVSNTPSSHYRSLVRTPLPIRRFDARVTQQDRKMAKRLARYTGVPAHELVQLRRQGYGWAEIGRWLRVPGRVVSAARNQQSWNDFLREDCACRDNDDGRRDDRRRGRVVVTNTVYDVCGH